MNTYRVMRGFALNWGPYTDVAPGAPDTVELPEQIARPFLIAGKLLMTTGHTASPVNPITGNISNPDVITTRDPVPAKIAAMGSGKRRK